MASAHIQINGTGSRHNQKLRQFVDELIAAFITQMTSRLG